MDDSTRSAVLEDVGAELARLWDDLRGAPESGLESAARTVRDRMLVLGARLLEAAVAARGTGKARGRIACACGGAATFAGYRRKGVQTVGGGITVRRAYYACAACGHGRCPLDAGLGLAWDSLSPEVRRLASRCGARLPFAEAAATLAETARIRVSASTVRTVTEAVGAQREADLALTIAAAWSAGLPAVGGPPPERLYVALDGVRILGTDGTGHEVKVGVVQPVRRIAGDERRAQASYAAGLEPAAVFGRRLAVEAHRRGLEEAWAIAVLGDGAAWIWLLAEEHFPGALPIVDWCHASERIWALGRALHGTETPETAAWVDQQLARLAQGQAARLATEWQTLPCHGEAATIRDDQVTSFTNQASRMASHQSRAAGWDIGSGMVESACQHLIAAREKGAGMRWSETGAHTVAAVRVMLRNEGGEPDALAA
jgi:hypothetical protein